VENDDDDVGLVFALSRFLVVGVVEEEEDEDEEAPLKLLPGSNFHGFS